MAKFDKVLAMQICIPLVAIVLLLVAFYFRDNIMGFLGMGDNEGFSAKKKKTSAAKKANKAIGDMDDELTKSTRFDLPWDKKKKKHKK